MPLSNQRFVTTWTSEDSIQWRMYIIPSSVDYITPALSSNVTLPSEFLLRDMRSVEYSQKMIVLRLLIRSCAFMEVVSKILS